MSEECVYRRLLDFAERGIDGVDVLDLADLMLQEAELREDNDERNRIRDEVNGWLAEWERRFVRPSELGDVGELIAGDDELLEGVEVDSHESDGVADLVKEIARDLRSWRDQLEDGNAFAAQLSIAIAWAKLERLHGREAEPDELAPMIEGLRDRGLLKDARDETS